jgi:iron complex outermembrane recepter protein
MRITALFLLAFFSYGLLRAQDISGTTVDSAGKPLLFASLLLKKFTDSSFRNYRETYSDTNGFYKFYRIPPGRYYVSVTAAGFVTDSSTAFEKTDSSLHIPPISLRLRGNITDVVVTAFRPLIEVKPDKIVVNVENTINAVGEDALGLLRKSPGVTVDNTNTISLNGKSSVQIYIDNRPTYLSGPALAQYLGTLQSSSIEAIEIIANPSARFEAAGTGGIINIRLKKDKSLGTNVTAGLNYNLGTYSKYTANLSFNTRNKDLNFFGDYTYHNGTDLFHSFENRTLPDSMFRQQNVIVLQSVSQTFHAGLDYFLNKKSTLGVLVSGTLYTDSTKTNSSTPIIYTPTNTTTRLLVADNRTSSLEDNYNFNLNYRYASGDGHELTLNADYGLYHLRLDQQQPNNYFDSTGKTFLYSKDYNILSPNDIHIYSFKTDYALNAWKGRLAIGVKFSEVNSVNDFEDYTEQGSQRLLDSLNSNHFTYKENINAAYAEYNRTFKTGLTLQAGLRVENTNSKGNSVGWQPALADYAVYDSVYPRHYTNLFPSASLSWKQWALSYSRRIDRPNYQDLNPFEFKIDDYTFSKGNTQLRPQYADNVNLTWSYKYALSATLSYSHIDNLFTTVPDTTDVSKTVVTNVNLSHQDIVGMNISYSFQYRWYSAYLNVNAYYALYKANFGEGKIIDINIFHTTILSQHTFQLGKGWSANLTELYISPYILQGTLHAHSQWSLDAGLQKTLWNGRATVKASVSDIFYTSHWAATSNFAGQYMNTGGNYESRLLKLGFIYRFGNIQVKATQRHIPGAEDENGRVNKKG